MDQRSDKDLKELYSRVIHCLLRRNETEHTVFESEEWKDAQDKSLSIMYRNMEDGGFELKVYDSGIKFQN